MLVVNERTKRISSKQLVETALHVLVAWNGGSDPACDDIEILQNAFPASARLPANELACRMIHELSGRAFREAEQSPVPDQRMDEVA
jgi:hypothetical protein